MTSSDRADDYLDFLRRRALPDYRAVAGNLAAYVLRRSEGDRTHFLTLTFWDSRESIKAFSGPDIDRAKYYPEDDGFLLEFESHVQHYEVFAA